MESSGSTNSNNALIRVQEYRTDPWYGKYYYCVRVYLPEALALKSTSHSGIDHRITTRREWGRKFTKNPGFWHTEWNSVEITDQDVKNLHAMYDFLLDRRDQNKIMISMDWMYIYTNDHAMIDAVCDLDFLSKPVKIIRCELQGESGTICLKNPRHQYRSYLRYRKLSQSIAESLRNYLGNQESIRMSPSLKNWVTGSRWDIVQDHLFFDHDDLSITSMLALISPGITRKTQRIVADK